MPTFRPLARFIPVALAAIMLDCHTMPPSGPNGFLTGTWGRYGPAGYIQITLQSAGGIVKGTYLDVCCGTEGIETDGTVNGTYGGGGFTLALTFPAKASYWMGTSASWVGHLTEVNGSDWLEGSLTENAPADSTLASNWSMVRAASQ